MKILAVAMSNLIDEIRLDPKFNKLGVTEDEIILTYLKGRGASQKILDPIIEKIASNHAKKEVANELNKIFIGVRKASASSEE